MLTGAVWATMSLKTILRCYTKRAMSGTKYFNSPKPIDMYKPFVIANIFMGFWIIIFNR